MLQTGQNPTTYRHVTCMVDMCGSLIVHACNPKHFDFYASECPSIDYKLNCILFQEHFDVQYYIHSYMVEATDIYTDLG